MDDVIKGIIIFDTNFITENANNLKAIIEKLSKKYNVFITEISVREILSQKYVKLKKNYEEANSLRKKIDIEIKKNLDEQYELDREKITQYYSQQFGKRIIPFNTDKITLQIILDRVHKKVPPFDKDGTGDKGFKDTLIWLSILEYFKNNEVKHNQASSIIFLTSDKVFHKYSVALQQEFFSATELNIEIKQNNDYEQLLDEKNKVLTGSAKENVEQTNKMLPPQTITMLRKEISEVITKLCYDTEDVLFGGPYFIIHEIIEGDFVEMAFKEMEKNYSEHFLEHDISPNIFFGDWNFIESIRNIPMDNVEKAVELYRTIKTDYRQYLIQFYNAAAVIFNGNYRDKSIGVDESTSGLDSFGMN